MLSIIHDFKFKFAKPIDGEVVIWSKVSIDKDILLKIMNKDEQICYRFVHSKEGMPLLNSSNALLSYIQNDNQLEDIYRSIKLLKRFYYNGVLQNIDFDLVNEKKASEEGQNV